MIPRKRPVSVHRSRSILALWMAPLWRAQLIAENTFSTSMERALTGLVRTSSKLRWSTVGVGGVILPEVLVAFLFCTTVHPPPERGGVAAAAANVLWGGGGGGGALAARAWVAGFGTVGGGIGVGGGLDWALPPKGVLGAFGRDGGGGGGRCLGGHIRHGDLLRHCWSGRLWGYNPGPASGYGWGWGRGGGRRCVDLAPNPVQQLLLLA